MSHSDEALDRTEGCSNGVSRAEALAPLLAEYRDVAERDACMALPVAEALRSAGLFRITAPKRAGGEAATVRSFVDTVATLAKTCPGSAWAYGIVTASIGMAASLPKDAASTAVQATGRAKLFRGLEDGHRETDRQSFLVSGQWPYAPGCLQPNGAWCGAVTQHASIDLAGAEVGIERDWNVTGLSASGSHRVTADGHFVSSQLVVRDSELANPASFAEDEEAKPRDRWPAEPPFALTLVPSMRRRRARDVRTRTNERR